MDDALKALIREGRIKVVKYRGQSYYVESSLSSEAAIKMLEEKEMLQGYG